MKKNLAIFEFYLHEMIYKLLLLIVIMAGIEGLCLFLSLKNSDSPVLPSFSDLIYAGGINYLILGFTVLCLFICLLPLKNRTSLQLRLTCLGASKKNLLVSKSLANLLIFLIFWLAQYVLLAGAVFWYTKQPAYTGGPQGPLVIYHNSGLLSLFSSRFSYLPLGWYVFSLIAIAIITALINLSYLEKGRFKSLLGLLLLLPIFFVASSLDKRHAFICIGYTIVLCIITVFFYLHPYKSSKHSSIENIDFIEKLEGIGPEDTK